MSYRLPPEKSQADIRKHIRNLRKNLCQQQQTDHGIQAAKHFADWLSQQKISPTQKIKIAVFLSQDGELAIKPLIEMLWNQPNVELYLPIIDQDLSKPMLFGNFHQDTKMQPNQYGIPEPENLETQPRIAAENLDWVLTPLVAYDAKGYRIGMGGGFYDRSFAFKKKQSAEKPIMIGWAHSFQEVEVIEQNEWDIPLDYLVSEKSWRKF